jgi:transposase
MARCTAGVRGVAPPFQALATGGRARRGGEYPAGPHAPEAECSADGLSRLHGGACPPACGGCPHTKGDHALGRSRGGLRPKRHAGCGAESEAVDLRIMAGQAGDAPVGAERRDARETRQGSAPAARDQAEDSNAIRAKLAAQGSEPVSPPTANRLDGMLSDQAPYTPRHTVERLCNTMPQCRSIATRDENRTATFLGFVTLALIVIM